MPGHHVHMNGEGRWVAGPCEAKSQDTCPYGGYEGAQHFTSREEAVRHAENMTEKSTGETRVTRKALQEREIEVRRKRITRTLEESSKATDSEFELILEMLPDEGFIRTAYHSCAHRHANNVTVGMIKQNVANKIVISSPEGEYTYLKYEIHYNTLTREAKIITSDWDGDGKETHEIPEKAFTNLFRKVAINYGRRYACENNLVEYDSVEGYLNPLEGQMTDDDYFQLGSAVIENIADTPPEETPYVFTWDQENNDPYLEEERELAEWEIELLRGETNE